MQGDPAAPTGHKFPTIQGAIFTIDAGSEIENLKSMGMQVKRPHIYAYYVSDTIIHLVLTAEVKP